MSNNTSRQQLKARFEELCTKEGATLPDETDIAEVGAIIQKAGATNEDCTAFQEWAKVMAEGKATQREMAIQNATEIQPPQPDEVAGWIFKPMAYIVAPVEFHSLINEVITKKALRGLFDSKTGTPNVDELLDELMMAEAFNVSCSLTHYTEELRRYNIIQGDGSFFDRDFTRLLLATLKEAVQALKKHSDQPNRLKKDIADIVQRFDDVPIWGIFFQILTLQGLVDLLERLDINEGDRGFDEAQAFLNWVFELLIEKEYHFACVNSIAYGDGDLLRLQPLCEYLMTTTAGRAVQEYIKRPQQHSNTAAAPTSTSRPQPLTRHFNSTLTDGKLLAIYNNLVDGEYLPDKGESAWLWICTGKGENVPTEPLKWTGRQNTLAEFANWICGDKNNTDWETTAACFLIVDKTGNVKKPNINAMKQHKISESEKTKLLNLLKTAAQ